MVSVTVKENWRRQVQMYELSSSDFNLITVCNDTQWKEIQVWSFYLCGRNSNHFRMYFQASQSLTPASFIYQKILDSVFWTESVSFVIVSLCCFDELKLLLKVLVLVSVVNECFIFLEHFSFPSPIFYAKWGKTFVFIPNWIFVIGKQRRNYVV